MCWLLQDLTVINHYYYLRFMNQKKRVTEITHGQGWSQDSKQKFVLFWVFLFLIGCLITASDKQHQCEQWLPGHAWTCRSTSRVPLLCSSAPTVLSCSCLLPAPKSLRGPSLGTYILRTEPRPWCLTYLKAASKTVIFLFLEVAWYCGSSVFSLGSH